ncbi:MAG: kynureninase, partial [Pseudomonadota bacterium]
MTTLAKAREFDAADPLGRFRDEFHLPEGVIYLDGNSLGCLPRATPAAMSRAIEEEWGEGLIRSWNEAGWFEMGSRVGAKIAPLIGAQPHEVIACDTVSANLFKLIAAALEMRPGRKVILSEPGNFPTDIYMIQGLERQGLAEQRLAPREELLDAL